MDNDYIDKLYVELVGRIDHIDRAFTVRRHIKLHYAKSMPSESSSEYLKVRKEFDEFFSANEEALLWFVTVELWSRFTANSKRGIRSLIYKIGDDQLKSGYSNFKSTHKEVIGYIDTQRLQYFTHGDEVNWKDFPNIWDKEYENIINHIKDLLRSVAEKISNQRIPSFNQRYAEEHTDMLFDYLLQHISPDSNVKIISDKFKLGLDEFKKS